MGASTQSTRSRRLSLVIVTMLVVLGSVPGVALAETRVDESVVVESGEVVNGDLTVIAGSVTIKGRVEGDLRAIGATVRITGTVTGDVTATGGSVVITRDGVVRGTLETAAGTVVLAGTVNGSVRAKAGTITLASRATVGGDLVSDGVLTRAAGATVGGTVRTETGVGVGSVFDVSIPKWVPLVYFFVVGLLAILLLVTIFPAFSTAVARGIADDPLRSGGAGLLTLGGMPVVLAAVAITLVGIPLSLVGLGAYLIGVLCGGLYGRYALGHYLLSERGYENRFVASLVGFLFVAVIVRVPLVGNVLNLLVMVVGFGGLAEVLYSRYRGRRTSEGEGDEYDRSQGTTSE